MSGRIDRALATAGRAGARIASEVVELTDEESWTRLRSQKLGRVCIIAAGRRHIFPVNYAVGDRTIVFRTAPGAKLEHGPGSTTCFEVDAYDGHTMEGWSVMAWGILEEITDARDERSRSLRMLPVQPAAPGTRPHWIALRVEEVTGRCFSGGWIVPGVYLG